MPRHGDYYSLDKLPRWRPIPVITGPGERRGCKKRDRPCCTPFHLFPFNDALVIGTVISRHLRKEYPLFFLYIWLSLALDSCNRWIIIDFSRFFILLKRVSIIVYIYIYIHSWPPVYSKQFLTLDASSFPRRLLEKGRTSRDSAAVLFSFFLFSPLWCPGSSWLMVDGSRRGQDVRNGVQRCTNIRLSWWDLVSPRIPRGEPRFLLALPPENIRLDTRSRADLPLVFERFRITRVR